MKKIIVATDFSPAATNAVLYARDMATFLGANIYLLHVCEIPITFTELPGAIDDSRLMKDAEKQMRRVKENLFAENGFGYPVFTEVRVGPFLRELEDFCLIEKPYMVIMGSQGKTAAPRVFMGSHTIYAMKHLQWPMLAVPAAASFRPAWRIGLACDMKQVEETVPVETIRSFVNDLNADFHVINSRPVDRFDPDTVFQSWRMEEIFPKLETQYHFVTNKDVDQGILDCVAQNRIAMLMVMHKQHNLVDRILHKSHAKKLILHSQVPVLVLQAKRVMAQ